jgi:hypothetical protein
MEKEKIKEAFSKVKQDIFTLGNEISQIKSEIHEIKQLLTSFHNLLNTQKLHEIVENDSSTVRQINTTHPVSSTHNSTVPQEIEGLKGPNLGISTGNGGVSTDRQTDSSTDRHMRNTLFSEQKTSSNNLQNSPEYSKKDVEENIQEASKILDSLDKLKKQIRLKFKRVTSQEMAVFSTIYQLEERNPQLSNYKQISLKLGLSESSIRDYVQRMINKGIPLKKSKLDNKKIILSISPELRKIATLDTILKLRDL